MIQTFFTKYQAVRITHESFRRIYTFQTEWQTLLSHGNSSIMPHSSILIVVTTIWKNKNSLKTIILMFNRSSILKQETTAYEEETGEKLKIIFVNNMLHLQTVFWVRLLIVSLFFTRKVVKSMSIAEALITKCAIDCGVEAEKFQKGHASSQSLLEASIQKLIECVKHCTGPPPVEDYYYY
ncbi:hypothetical protein MN116_001337 [Schistosoma mekongi]|uniref:Uncharacterized protein n=1 Tax=Schistosoma mekongi TaxID=38744 RepID=A0AAE1ZLL8_SCHME|nr:hypothetical protein MN116_001337 [Schistosoma mekongi]